MRALLFALPLLAGCGLTPDKFESRFEVQYCYEYENCFEDFTCFDTPLERPDYSDCDFNTANAQDCLESQWSCVTTDGPRYVQIPASCGEVYSNCNVTEGSTILYTGTPTGGT